MNKQHLDKAIEAFTKVGKALGVLAPIMFCNFFHAKTQRCEGAKKIYLASLRLCVNQLFDHNMSEQSQTFIAKSTIKAADLEHRRKINFNIGKYNAVVPKGKEQFADVHLARERAKNLKWRAIETLDQQLEEFELNFTKRGGKVIWAENSDQAIEEILKICKEKNCKTLVKSKSMVTEEIHLNDALEKNGIESVETDLGEYIQQLDGEAPYHIVTPAMHKSKEDVAKAF